MRSLYFPKTPEPRRDERGSVSLIVVFLFVLFAGLGLSMIFLSQVYLKLNSWRKSSTVLDYASENGVKRGFQELVECLDSTVPLVPVPDESLEELRADPEAGLSLFLDGSLGISFPRAGEETWEGLNWRCVTSCDLRNLEDRGPYSVIRAGIHIESEGSLVGRAPLRTSSLEADLVLIAGRIPLASLPLLLNKEPEGADPAEIEEVRGISLAARPGEMIEARPVLAGGPLIPEDATPILGRALDIELLRPQDLSPGRLRVLLGLEESDEPVPEGVYLIRNDLGLGGVFVQGDLGEMITAIEEDSQVVAFRMEAGEWILKFSPSRSRTEFQTPAAVESFDLVPAGMIIVNGRVVNLGGGEVGPDGEVRLVTDREIPSVLGGVALTIVASDKITLTSHLILQNVHWQDAIPTVRDPQSQVVIYSAGRDVLSGAAREGGIDVAGEAPADMKIHASLTAAGGGFEILGEGRTVELLGGLQTVGYAGHGNALRIVPDARILSGSGPLSATPVASVLSLQILGWQEY